MKKWIKFATVATLMVIVSAVSYWFVTTNPFKFSLQDVKDVLKQVFVYSFAAGVAIFGYWWTQREQDRRHDDQIYEARWNKTLDVQMEALEKLSRDRVELEIELMKVFKLDSNKFLTNRDFRDLKLFDLYVQAKWLSNHISFYLNHENFYLMDIAFEMRVAIDELELYCDQVLPVPEGVSEELEDLVALAVKRHAIKVLMLSQILDWEIGCLIEGKTVNRYDLDQEDETQWDNHDDTATYLKWKVQAYKDARKALGLTDTNVILNERMDTEQKPH